MKARLSEGRAARSSTMPLRDYALAWLESGLLAGERSDSSRRVYASLARLHIINDPLGARRLDTLRPSDIDAWKIGLRKKITRRKRPLSPATHAQAFKVLSLILKAAARDGLIPRSPTEDVARPRVEAKERLHLARADIIRGLEAITEDRYRDLFEVIAWTGTRQGEARALRWPDIDLDVGRILVRGTKSARSRRTLPMTQRVREAVQRAQARQSVEREHAGSEWQEGGYVFTRPDGRPLPSETTIRRWRDAAQAAGINAVSTPHALRHAMATTLLLDGEPVHVVSRFLGHARPSITLDVYAHLRGEEVDDALRRYAEGRRST